MDLGYKSKAKNVLGSVGNLLYGKKSPFKSKGGKFYLAEGAAGGSNDGNGLNAETPKPARKKRKMSPEGRAKIAAAARARWAKARAGK